MGRTRLPPRGTGLAPLSFRSPRLPRLGGRGNLGEVKAASPRLRLRPRRCGHRGIGRESGDEEMEPRCDGSHRGHGEGGEGCSQGWMWRGLGSLRVTQDPLWTPQSVPVRPSRMNRTSLSRAAWCRGDADPGGLWVGDRDPLWDHSMIWGQTSGRSHELSPEWSHWEHWEYWKWGAQHRILQERTLSRGSL